MKIIIGSCTKHDTDGFEKTPLYRSLLREYSHESHNDYELYESQHGVNAIIKTKNSENIGKHYNKVLEMAVSEEFDCAILVHDDVSVEDAFLASKIRQGFEDHDIVGLAGAIQIQIQSPVLWHLMSKQGQWTGSVAHPFSSGQILTTSFGPTPQRCLVLDGLFLAIKVSSLTPEIKFDENIPGIAHHYDLDFCLNANKHKLKLTTWPIWVVHQSSGLGQPDPDFVDSEKYFLDKWAEN